MATSKVVQILEGVGAVMVGGHFVYTSGMHGSVYINKDALYPHVEEVGKVGRLFAESFAGDAVETVAAPALGGIVLSQWTAHHLTKLRKARVSSVYAEKTEDKCFTFTRGYDKHVRGNKVLVLEDLTTTGGSVKKVVDVVRKFGGEVVGVGVMVNRNPGVVNEEMFATKFVSLGTIEAEAFEEDDCPMCVSNIPVNTEVGHGSKYLKRERK